MSLSRTYKNTCREGTTNPQWSGFKEGLWAYFPLCRHAFQHWKAYALCRWSDGAMLSCHLFMDGWLLPKHSLPLNQAAPLPCMRSTKIIVWGRKFTVASIERLSAILPKDDTCDWGKRDWETGSKTISGRSSGWYHRRCLLECEMHLHDDYYRTPYLSYCLSRYAEGFDGLGNVLPQTAFQDREIQPALGDDAAISWLCSIQQAIWPGDALER